MIDGGASDGGANHGFGGSGAGIDGIGQVGGGIDGILLKTGTTGSSSKPKPGGKEPLGSFCGNFELSASKSLSWLSSTSNGS